MSFRYNSSVLKIVEDLGSNALHDGPYLSPEFSLELFEAQEGQIVEEPHVEEPDLSPLAGQSVQKVDEKIGVAEFEQKEGYCSGKPEAADWEHSEERVHQDGCSDVGEGHQGGGQEHPVPAHELVTVLLRGASLLPVAPLRLHHVVDQLGSWSPQK